MYQHAWNVSIKFQKDILSRTGYIDILAKFSKEVSQLTDWETYKKFRIICINCRFIPGRPPKIFRKTSHAKIEISLKYLILVSNSANQQADRHTRNSEWFGNSLQTFQECLQKIWERYLIQNQSYKWMKLVETDVRRNERTDECSLS